VLIVGADLFACERGAFVTPDAFFKQAQAQKKRQEEAFMEDSLELDRVQKGDSAKGAPRIIVKIMKKWNLSGMEAKGEAWVKAVELAFANYWGSAQGQARKADIRAKVTLQHAS
jgi:hypothetical protein